MCVGNVCFILHMENTLSIIFLLCHMAFSLTYVVLSLFSSYGSTFSGPALVPSLLGAVTL